jgi:hypothetical protein
VQGHQEDAKAREAHSYYQCRFSVGSARGRTDCMRLSSTLPGSSHGIICEERSNHTPCFAGAPSLASQSAVGCAGVV